jgi:HK97 family phage major capsid protein
MPSQETVDRIYQVLGQAKDVKESGGDLDIEKVTKAVAPLLEQMTKEQVELQMEKQLVPIRQDNSFNGVDIDKNPYGYIAKSIAKDGYFRVGPKSKLCLADLVFAKEILKITHGRNNDHLDGIIHALKPMSGIPKFLRSDVLTEGQDLTPDETKDMLWQDFYLQDQLFSLFPPINIEMDVTDRTRHPAITSDDDWRKVGQGVAVDVQTPVTARPTITYTELAVAIEWSSQVEDDAVIAMAPVLRQRLINSARRKISDFVINADKTQAATGNINSDDALPPANAYYISNGQNGLIRQWLIDNTAQAIDAGGDALVLADMKNMFNAIDRYFEDLSDNVGIVTNVAGWLSIMLLNNVVTVANETRSDAVVLRGNVREFLGKPIIVSDAHGLAEADGKLSATASNNTLGRITCFNAKMWKVGGRNLTLESYREAKRRMSGIVGSMEIGVAAFGDRASNTHTSGIYNILV